MSVRYHHMMQMSATVPLTAKIVYLFASIATVHLDNSAGEYASFSYMFCLRKVCAARLSQQVFKMKMVCGMLICEHLVSAGHGTKGI